MEVTKEDDTRERLLKSAIDVFAEKGYEAATVREICKRARANGALVNYYFGDKMELYTQVLRSVCCGPGPQTLPTLEGDPEEGLRKLIAAILEKAVERGVQRTVHYQLMMHEMVKPTAAAEMVVDLSMRPVYDQMRAVVGKILGKPSDDTAVRLCTHSIFGQIIHFANPQKISQLWPEMTMDAEQRKMVAKYIGDLMLGYFRLLRSRDFTRQAIRGEG